ncbi:MAG: hypothetical protein CM15mP128_2510 [Methanobacteriota archaeon]|nr:MAG: hypothetical protein CM15mP128_2510 [Euryarchaeota archaeon]
MQSESRRRLVVEGGERIIDFNHKAFKPIPEEGIAMATDAMRRGVMYRYQPRPKEESLTARFKNFRRIHGHKAPIGTFLALHVHRAEHRRGETPGDKVLTNAHLPPRAPRVSTTPVLSPCWWKRTASGAWTPRPDRKGPNPAKPLMPLRGPRARHGGGGGVEARPFPIEDCAHPYCTTGGGPPSAPSATWGVFPPPSKDEAGRRIFRDQRRRVAAGCPVRRFYEKLGRSTTASTRDDGRFQTNPRLFHAHAEVTAHAASPKISPVGRHSEIPVRNHALLALLATPQHRDPLAPPKAGNFHTPCSSTWGMTTPRPRPSYVAKHEGFPLQILDRGKPANPSGPSDATGTTCP